MKDIIINSSDYEYLIANITDKEIVESIKKDSEQKFTSFHLLIDEYLCEKILDFLSNKLIQSGLRDNDEPNNFGLYLENLIDKFSDPFYNG